MFRPYLRGGTCGPPRKSEGGSEAGSEYPTQSEVGVRYSDPASGASPVALLASQMFRPECPTLLLSQRADILEDYIRRPSSTFGR